MLQRIIICLFLLCFSAKGQQYNFRNYTVDDGLPFIHAYAIYQDSKGNLWIGGYGGLSKFDGIRFTNYSPKEGLANYFVTSITEDRNGNLWIGTNGGLSKFDGKSFENYTVNEGLPADQITSLLTGDDGILWIGTLKGLVKFDGTYLEIFNKEAGLLCEEVRALAKGSNGNVWVGTDKGVNRFPKRQVDAQAQKQIFDSYVFTHNLPDSIVNSLYEDEQGNLWVGTNHGLISFDGNQSVRYTNKEGLSSNKISSLNSDEQGNLWVGTNKGLNKFNGKSFDAYRIGDRTQSNLVESVFLDYEANLWIGTYSGLFRYRGDKFVSYDARDGLTNTFIHGIARDNDHVLWIGSSGGGIYRYNKDVFENLTMKDGLPSNEVSDVRKLSDGNIWIATEQGVSVYKNGSFKNYDEKDGLLHPALRVIFEDSKGNVWLGGKSGITKYDGKRFTPYEFNDVVHDFEVWAMHEDKEGNLWIGTYLGGLYKYDGKEFLNIGKQLGIDNDAFLAIIEDRYQNIWLGTFDGVYRYDTKKNKIDQFSEAEGLSSNLVYLMCIGKEEQFLWVGTNQGLNKISLSAYWKNGEKVIEQYGKEEGFIGVECNTNGLFQEKDGSIWFGTVDGLIKYTPMDYMFNKTEPKTNITGFRVFYNDTILPPDAVLAYDQNNITIFYVGISLINPEKVRYQYVLEGFDDHWSPITKDNHATFSNLPPGKYTFKVKSRNNELIWNEVPTSYSFRITPPYWLTWWFWLLVSIIVVFTTILIIRYRLRVVRRKEREKLEQETIIATSKLKALKSQMNPHFIFNSLNSIQHFILNSNDGSAYKYLSKFAKLIRKILNNSEKSQVKIAEELETIELYLELEVLRFEGKFEYKIEVEKSVDAEYHAIPSMLIQPFVENAILHGIMPKKEGKGLLIINIKEENDSLICTISDNGIGRKKSRAIQALSIKDHKSMGMKITEERLAVLNKIHQSNMSIKITDLYDEEEKSMGTKVEIFIPLTEAR